MNILYDLHYFFNVFRKVFRTQQCQFSLHEPLLQITFLVARKLASAVFIHNKAYLVSVGPSHSSNVCL